MPIVNLDHSDKHCLPSPSKTNEAAAEFQTYRNNQREFRLLWGDH